MFDRLTSLFNRKTPQQIPLTADEISELLKVNPNAMQFFEQKYQQLMDQPAEDFFETNSRMAAAQTKKLSQDSIQKHLQEIVDRIVQELVADTNLYIYDGASGHFYQEPSLTPDVKLVTNSELQMFPEEIRPQLTSTLMKVDISEKSCYAILYHLKEFLSATNLKKKQIHYNQFRQGLDILDLDYITYKIIEMNQNSISHWFPALVDSAQKQSFFKIPATVIAQVPLTMLQLTRQPYEGLTPTTLSIVDRWAHHVFRLQDDKEYFIKTGTYSSKFDFRNCHVHGEKEVRELGEYLLFIHFQALMMASPLAQPHSIYGVSTTNEWVVREFIHDVENNPCIYKGLPLHTEYRVFVDCDTKTVLSIVPYWDPETMKNRFGNSDDSDTIHQKHDYVIYKAHEDALMKRYEENKSQVAMQVEKLLQTLNLSGQWSIDIMQNGNDFWLIDMALAQNSAFYNSIPKELRKPSAENWIPELPNTTEDTL